MNPKAEYNLADSWEGAVGLNLFGGPRRAEFGQFEGNSNCVVVRYAF